MTERCNSCLKWFQSPGPTCLWAPWSSWQKEKVYLLSKQNEIQCTEVPRKKDWQDFSWLCENSGVIIKFCISIKIKTDLNIADLHKCCILSTSRLLIAPVLFYLIFFIFLLSTSPRWIVTLFWVCVSHWSQGLFVSGLLAPGRVSQNWSWVRASQRAIPTTLIAGKWCGLASYRPTTHCRGWLQCVLGISWRGDWFPYWLARLCSSLKFPLVRGSRLGWVSLYPLCLLPIHQSFNWWTGESFPCIFGAREWVLTVVCAYVPNDSSKYPSFLELKVLHPVTPSS